MFQTRQYEEIQPFVEISKANITPGAVNNATTVVTATAFLIGGIAGNPATFALGDQLEIFPSAAAACNGINVSAVPGPTAGTASVYFQNNTGGNITPVGGASYTIVATRITPTTI